MKKWPSNRCSRKRMNFYSNALSALLFLVLLFVCSAEHVFAFSAQKIGDHGNVMVMTVDGNYDANIAEGIPNGEPRRIVSKAFYETRSDDFDFIVIFTDFDFVMPEAEALAFYNPVKNDISGIGQEQLDNTTFYGSAGRLQGVIDMANVAKWSSDPLAPEFSETMNILSHEFLHRWVAFIQYQKTDGSLSKALLGKDETHWSFLLDLDGTIQYGNNWQNNGDGTFTTLSPVWHFSSLDLYLMGLVDKSDVSPMLLIDSEDTDHTRLPEEGVTISGNAQYISIDDIIAAEGERVPDWNTSQKKFTLGCILLTRNNTFDEAHLAAIRRILNQWEVWFSGLTDGRATVDFSATPYEAIEQNPGINGPLLAERTTPPAILEGVEWLVAQQNTDGSWFEKERFVGRDTALAVNAINGFSSAIASHDLGIDWLQNNTHENTDYLARKIEALALAGTDTEALTNNLIARQNDDGGWGSADGYASNPMDTALALSALSQVGLNDLPVQTAIAYLGTSQNSNGSWGAGTGSEDIQSTAYALNALSTYRLAYDIEATIQNAINWLALQQAPNGGFGPISPTVYETAMALLGLRTYAETEIIRNNAINYLFDQQLENDSWYNSVYQTALAIQALYAMHQNADLAVFTGDISVTPQAISEFPCQMTMDVTVANRGLADATYASIALYHDVIDDDHLIGNEVITISGQSYQSVSFNFSITEGISHRYFVVADADQSISENVETNNTAMKLITSAPSIDFKTSSDDLVITPDSVSVDNQILISTRVYNSGTRDAFHVPVRFYIDDNGTAYEIATLNETIPSNGYKQFSYTWTAKKIGTNQELHVQVDPFNAFDEVNEGDNSATAVLTVLPDPSPNLAISFTTITFDPEPALEAGTAVVSAVVTNNGGSDATNVQVQAGYHQSGQSITPIDTITIPTLAAGASETISMTWNTIPVSGEWLINFIADPDNIIDEYDESDNHAFKALNVLSLPEFVVETGSMTISPTVPAEGDQVTISIEIQNTGEQNGVNVPVTLYEGTSLLGTNTITIPALSQATTQFLYDTTGRSGMHTVTVSVNPTGAILEQHSGNNTTSKSFGVQNSDLWVDNPYMATGKNEGTSFFFRLDEAADVTVCVVDAYNRTVRTFSGPELENTMGTTIYWDGRDDNGKLVPDGIYTIQALGSGGQILASLQVTVDNNLSSLADAMGTKYLALKNTTCDLPEVEQIEWLPQENGIVFTVNYKDETSEDYPPGLYSMMPGGGDIVTIYEHQWPEEPDTYFSISSTGQQVAYITAECASDLETLTERQLWIATPYGENSHMVDTFPWADENGLLDHSESFSNKIFWSSDGQFMAYTVGINDSSESYKKELRIKSIDGDLSFAVTFDSTVIADSIQWNKYRPILLFRDYDYTAGQGVIKTVDIEGSLEVYSPEDPNEQYANPYWLDSRKFVVEKSDNFILIDTTQPEKRATFNGLENIESYQDFTINPTGGGFALIIKENHQEQGDGTDSGETGYNGYDGWVENDGYRNIVICEADGTCTTVHQARNITNGPFYESIDQLVWNHQGDKLAFIDYAYERVDQCTYNGHIVTYDLKTQSKTSYRILSNSSICEEIPDEVPYSFHIMAYNQGAWVEKSILHYGSSFATQYIDINSWNALEPDGLRLRILHTGTDYAEVDAIWLKINNQLYYPASAVDINTGEDILGKVVSDNDNAVDVAGATIEYIWMNLPLDEGVVSLNMRAREYSTQADAPDDDTESTSTAITVGNHILNDYSLKWLYDGVWLMAADIEGFYFINTYTSERKDLNIDEASLAGLNAFYIGGEHHYKISYFDFVIENGNVSIEQDWPNESLSLPKAKSYFASLGFYDGQWGIYYIDYNDTSKIDGYYAFPVGSNEPEIKVPHVFDFKLSPHSRYLTYNRFHDAEGVCSEKGRTDHWLTRSLLNLTADLRITKKEEAIYFKGTATDLNLNQWVLEYEDVQYPDQWNIIRPASSEMVVNDDMGFWIPPRPGTYNIRLRVSDMAGNTFEEQQRVTWGVSASVADIYLDDEYISTNGDGSKDNLQLNFTVIEPVNLIFNIYDDQGNLINTLERNYPDVPPETLQEVLLWDGLDKNGNPVDEGVYHIEVLGYDFVFTIDNTPPKVDISLSEINNWMKLQPDEYDKCTSETCRERFQKMVAMLSVYADDDFIESWSIESGKGEYPDLWQEIPFMGTGRTAMAEEIILPMLHYTEWPNTKYRITATDKSGNKASVSTELFEEALFIYRWYGEKEENWIDDIVFLTKYENGAIKTVSTDPIPSGYLLGESNCYLLYSSSIRNVTGFYVQFYDNLYESWYEEGNMIIKPSKYIFGNPAFKAKTDQGNIENINKIRIKAVNDSGEEYYSNEIRTEISFMSQLDCEYKELINVKNNLGWELKKLTITLQRFGFEDAIIKEWNVENGDVIPYGNFSFNYRRANPEIGILQLGDYLKLQAITFDGKDRKSISPVSCGAVIIRSLCGDENTDGASSCGKEPSFSVWFDSLGLESITAIHLKENGDMLILEEWDEDALIIYEREWIGLSLNSYKSQDKVQLHVVEKTGEQYVVEDSISCDGICFDLGCIENIEDSQWPLKIRTETELTGMMVEIETADGARTINRQWDKYQGDIVPQESFILWEIDDWEKPDLEVGDKIYVTAVDDSGNTYKTRETATESICDDENIGELPIDFESLCNEMRNKVDIRLDSNYNREDIIKAGLYVEQNAERRILYEHNFMDEEAFIYELNIDQIDEDGKYIISSGNVKLVAIYKAAEDNIFELQADLYVDRNAPTAQFDINVSGSEMCPELITMPDGSDALVLEIKGKAYDPKDLEEYSIYYSTQSGEDVNWSVAIDVNNKPIKGNQNVDGVIGTWLVPDNIGNNYFGLKLEAKDKAGNVSCDFIFLEILPIGITIGDKLFSPNGDFEKDQIDITLVTEDSYLVDLEIHGNKLIKTLLSGENINNEARLVNWDGTNNSGETVADGTYSVVMRATDKCGKITEKIIKEIIVDNTPPEVSIITPESDSTFLPTIVEITGSVNDLNLSQYRLELFIDIDGEPEETLGGGVRNIDNAIIYNWNTNGLVGPRVLRLWATDKAANKTVVDLPVELIAKVNVITALEVDTPYFSPNNDQRLDRATITYHLNDELGISFDTRLEILDSASNIVRSIEMNGIDIPDGQFVWDGNDSQALPLQDGRYKIMLTAALSGYPVTTQQEQINLILDNTLPEIQFASPVEGAYLAEDTTVQGSISDTHIDQYTISIEGEKVQKDIHSDLTGHTNYTFGVIDDLPDGVYALSAQADDMAQNQAAFQVNFTVDRTAPVVNIEAPADGSYFGGENGTVVIRGGIEETNLETWRLRYRLKKSGATWTDLVQNSAFPEDGNLFSWNIGGDAGIADGAYELSLHATDRAGWENEVIVTVTIDNTAPQAALSSPEEGGYVTASGAIQGTAADANLAQYELTYGEGECAEAYKWTPILRSETAVVDGEIAQWHLLPSDGDYCLRLTVEDRVGQNETVTRHVKVDTHPPEAPVLSGNIEDLENIRLNWTAAAEPDFAEFRVYRDGRQISAASLTQNEYVDAQLLEDSYVYTVTAVDAAGLESQPSNEVALEIDLTPPSARIRIPGDGDLVSDIVTISGTAFSDDDFKEYRVSVGHGTSPSTWQLLNSAPLATSYGQLAQWDCSGLVNGDVYTLKLEAEDIAGNIGIHRVAVTIDTLAPSPPVLISAEPQGPDSSDVVVIWQSNTEPDLAGYLLYRNNELVNVSGTVIGDLSPYLLSGTQYTDLGLADGEYQYYALAMDTTGNLSSPSNTLTVSIDTHAPQLSITEPEAGHRFDTPLVIRAVSDDLDIASVQFQYKTTSATLWVDLSAPLSDRPFVTYLDPEALGLEYGTYQIRTVGTDQGGRTDTDPQTVAIEYADITPPEAPVDLTALSQGDQVALAWSANSETDISGYHVYLYDFDQSAYIRLTTDVLTQTDYVHSDTTDGLADGLYLYRITAVDGSGNESARSDLAYATIYTPQVDQPYTPVSGNTAAIIGWVQPMHTVTLFSDTGNGPIASGTVDADDQGYFSAEMALQVGENVITVRGTDTDGNFSKDSPEVVVVRGVVPEAPTGLEAEVVDGNVNLTWQPNQETDLEGYNVFRDNEKLNTDSLFEGGTASASTMNYLASSVRDNDIYSYWYFYIYDEAPEAWWELDLGARQLITRIEIDWQENYASREFAVEGWSGYAWIPLVIVRYNESDQNVFDLASAYPTDRIRLRITAGANDDVPQTAYLTELRLWQANPVTTESYSDQSELNGEFDYHVTAVSDLALESPPSEPVTVTVGDVTPPAAPSLTASVTDSTVVLSWTTTDPQDTTGYYLFKLIDGQWSRLNEALLTTTQFTESNLPNGEYTYRVVAEDAVGNQSDPSNEATALVDIALLPEPASLTAESLPEGRSIEVCWEAVPGAAGYKLLRSLTAGGPYEAVTDTMIVDTCFTDTNLLNGYQYYYRVLPVDSLGNEGQQSLEGTAVPEDLLAPDAPVFLAPGLANQHVDVSEAVTHVIGWSEPGATVRLYLNETYYDNRIAATEDRYRQWATDMAAEDNMLAWAVSPDGKSLALSYYDESTYANVCRIYDLETDTYVSIDALLSTYTSVQTLSWSPDSSKLAMGIHDENDEVMIYDQKLGDITQLPQESGDYDEQNPVWDSDGDHLLFISDRQTGVDEVWRYTLTSGTLVVLTDQAGANSALISPDGRYLAYGVQVATDYHLYCLDLQAGGAASLVTDQLRVDAGIVPAAAWLADGTGLVYLDNTGAGGDIYRFTPENLGNTALTNEGDILAMAVDPSGRRIVYENVPEGEICLSMLSFPENDARTIEGNAPEAAVERLAFTSAGELFYVEENNVHIITPAGRFKMEDVRLEPGENRVAAQAVDESGNIGSLSDTLTINLDAQFLPDLKITSNDIYNVPYVPIQGDTVQFAMVVRNDGLAAAGDADVRAWIWYPDDSMEPVYNNPIASLAAGEETTIVFAWDSSGKSDKCSLLVEIDEYDRIVESSELNNMAFIDFYVAEGEGIHMYTDVEYDLYYADEEVNISVDLNNTGPEQDVELTVEILDADQNVVTLIEQTAFVLPYTPLDSRAYVWDSGEAMAGDYYLRARLEDTSGLLEEDLVAFTIEPQIDMVADIVSDKTHYGPGETVQVHATLMNQGKNVIVPQVDAVITITDPEGIDVFAYDQTITNLIGLTVSAINTQWPTELSAPGVYTMTMTVSDPSEPLASVEQTFVIDEVPMLSGTLTLTPAITTAGGLIDGQVQVDNQGNYDALGTVISIMVLDQTSQSEWQAAQVTADIPMGGQFTETLSFEAPAYDPGTYSVQLRSNSGDGSQVLAQTGLTLQTTTPTPVQIAGTLTAQPDIAIQGDTVELAYAVTNLSSYELLDVQVAIAVPAANLTLNPSAINVPPGVTVHGDVTVDTSSLITNEYTAQISVNNTLLSEAVTLAQATFKVEAALPRYYSPVALPGGPYMAAVGETISLDGSDSFDPDEGLSESGDPPYDTITEYAWEFDMVEPYGFDDALGAEVELQPYDAPGTYTIVLRVTDNSAEAFPGEGIPNLTGTASTDVVVSPHDFADLAARCKYTKCQLTWTHLGVAEYEVLRSETGPNSGFEVIATTDSTYSTYLDDPIEMYKDYWYRVRAVVDSQTVLSNAVYVYSVGRTR